MKIKIFIVIGIIPLYLIVIINYIIDPYGVFESNFFKQPGAIQERFYKINYLTKNLFSEILLGSSRVGSINTENINIKFNKNIYNFYISSGNMAEFEYIVKWIPYNLSHIKAIYIQIDWPENYGLAGDQLQYQMHPDIIKKSKIDFFKNYLFTLQYEGIKYKLRRNFTNEYLEYKFDFKNGNFSYPERDNLLKTDCDGYQSRTGYFKNKNTEIAKSLRQDSINTQTLESISRIKKYAKNKNIDIIFFTAPHNMNYIDKINTEEYISFIRKLANITDFHNFLFYNKLTKNNCNYYETSHYTDDISTEIFNALLVRNNLSHSHFTTSKNVDDEIIFLKNNFKKNRTLQ